MQITSIEGLLAKCEAKGVEREANLLMLEHEAPAVGDFVVVQLGYAVDKVTAEQAAAAWEIYDEILEAVHTATAASGPRVETESATNC